MLISEPTGAPKILDQIINFTAMVPLQVQKLIDEKANFSKIKKLIIGGASIDSSLQKSLLKINTEVFVTYGMTETCSHIALQRINGKNPDNYFKVLDGISISTNEDGCLNIFSPELSEETIQTNDLVKIISPCEFSLIGRNDHIINSGGLKILPEQIEKQIKPVINCEYAIIPLPDKLLGQRIVLVIEGKQSDFDTAQLSVEISKVTDKKKAPKAIYFVEQLPRNASMKIDRKLLEQQFSNRIDSK
jgi:O-succinylbenzoic acid--CoA ligase